METLNPNLQSLLALLHSWHPLSQGFRTELSKAIQPYSVQPKQTLYHYGIHLHAAWYSIDCWIAKHRIPENGNEEVSQFFQPGEILTDLTSFLKGQTTQTRATILEGSTLLHLSRPQFDRLKAHPETQALLQEYMLGQKHKEHWRMDLLGLNDQQKIHQFAQRYPINRLPASTIASFLRIPPSRFSILRGSYNRSH